LKVRSRQYEIALSTFEKIRVAFPALKMEVDLDPKYVELAIDIRAQPGLSFDIDLNLQNRDELHVEASRLWVEWFPCTNPKKVEEYFEAVSGLLSGQFRILEHWRGKQMVKAELQRPIDNSWENVATCSNLLAVPWPPKTLKVVQNLPFV
jgi:hypothetical protein